MAWDRNFSRSWAQDDTLRAAHGGAEAAERFYRLWHYYLMLCAAAFRSRRYQLWQMVLSPGGVLGGYRSVR